MPSQALQVICNENINQRSPSIMSDIHNLELHSEQIHIWHSDLDGVSPLALSSYLSADEKIRASRFHFEKDRRRFIAARGWLRFILAYYLQAKPDQLGFIYNEYGKPELINSSGITFNISHSENIALFAFAKNLTLGIDIEAKNRRCDMDGIAQRFFSEAEYAVLKNLSEEKKRDAFFNGWTRKEAFLKAIGQGLSYSLNNVEVTLLPEDKAEFIAIHDNENNKEEWSLYNLDINPDYAAALALKGKAESIRLIDSCSFHPV